MTGHIQQQPADHPLTYTQQLARFARLCATDRNFVQTRLAYILAGYADHEEIQLPRWSRIAYPLTRMREVAAAKLEPAPEEVKNAIDAVILTAKKEHLLFELIALLGSDPELKERGIYKRICLLKATSSIKTSQHGWRYMPTERPAHPRVTWKTGESFRHSGAPYCFVRLDGRWIVELWPYNGARTTWLD